MARHGNTVKRVMAVFVSLCEFNRPDRGVEENRAEIFFCDAIADEEADDRVGVDIKRGAAYR